jgi:hypothetical protein
MHSDFPWRSYWFYLSSHGPPRSSDSEYSSALTLVAEASKNGEIPLFGTSPANMRLQFIAMLEKNSSNTKKKNCLFEVFQLFMMICRDNMISPDNIKRLLSMSPQCSTRRNVMDAVFIAIKPVVEDDDNSDGNDRPRNSWHICKESPIKREWCSIFEDILWESAFSPIRVHSTYNSNAERNTVRPSVLKTSATAMGEILIRDLNKTIETAKKPVDERLQRQATYYDIKGENLLPFIQLFFFQFRLDRNGHDHYIREELKNLQSKQEDKRSIEEKGDTNMPVLSSNQTPYTECKTIIDCMILVCMLSETTYDLATDAPNILTFMRDELGGRDSDVHTSKMSLTSHVLNRTIELVKLRLLIGSEWPNMEVDQLTRTTASVVTAIVSTFIHWIDGPMSFDMAMFVVQVEIDDKMLNQALSGVKMDHKKHTSKRTNTGTFPVAVGASKYTLIKRSQISRADSSQQWRRTSS